MTWHLVTIIRKTRLGLSLLATISLTLLSTSPARAGTTITPMPGVCPAAVILEPGEYDLAGDVGPCPAGIVDGIDIFASNVTLHLNGHTIAGDPAVCSSTGIHVGLFAPLPPLAQVRIVGPGTIDNFTVGFLARNSAGSSVKFVTVTASTCVPLTVAFRGFVTATDTSQWKFEGNAVLENPATSVGIVLFGNDNDLVGGVPSGVEIEKWRILPVGSPTTNRPSGKTAAGGMRHGEAYQEVGAAA